MADLLDFISEFLFSPFQPLEISIVGQTEATNYAPIKQPEPLPPMLFKTFVQFGHSKVERTWVCFLGQPFP